MSHDDVVNKLSQVKVEPNFVKELSSDCKKWYMEILKKQFPSLYCIFYIFPKFWFVPVLVKLIHNESQHNFHKKYKIVNAGTSVLNTTHFQITPIDDKIKNAKVNVYCVFNKLELI